MAAYPEQVFQNNMVHHPLLQYQMLFPSLLLSLGAPPSGGEGDTIDDEGRVNPMDYLRFSALANQLAITQINQVLMDLVMESPGEDIKKMTELQKNFLGLVKKGFFQLNQEIAGSKKLAANNNQLIVEQGDSLAILQDTVATGFLDSLAKMVDLQESSRRLSNSTTSQARGIQEKLLLIGDSLRGIKNAINNQTEELLICIAPDVTQPTYSGVTPATEAPLFSNSILESIQGELRNLTRSLGDFISALEESSSARELMKNLTTKIAETMTSHLDEIQPQVRNISEGLGRVDSVLLLARDDLSAIRETLTSNLTKSRNDLHALTQFTMDGFADLSAKIENLYNASVFDQISQEKTQCPTEFFAVGDECFFLKTDDPMSFDAAKEKCNEINSFLAEPQSLLKFLAFTGDLDYNKTMGVWMGGRGKVKTTTNDGESTGFVDYEWCWLDSGLEITHGWNMNQPLAREYCLLLYDMGLHSAECSGDRGFVCESLS